jgi:hypothetical protein
MAIPKPTILWSPNVGDTIIGTITNSGSGFNQWGTETYKYMIDTDTNRLEVSASKMLQNILKQIPIGTIVKIQYNGLAQPKWSNSGHPYHHFDVWKQDVCPTCGSHTMWREAIKQKIKSPVYVQPVGVNP